MVVVSIYWLLEAVFPPRFRRGGYFFCCCLEFERMVVYCSFGGALEEARWLWFGGEWPSLFELVMSIACDFLGLRLLRWENY